MSPRELIDTAKQLLKKVGDDDLTGLAAELSYRLLLALFPFFIFLAALGGFVAAAANIDNPTERIMDNLQDNLPVDAASVLEGQLEEVLENQNPGLLSVGILGAIWGSSAAMNTAIKAFNRAYHVEETRPFLKRTFLALGLTVLAGVFLVGAFAMLIVGQLFAGAIGDAIGLEGALVTLLNILRFPFVALLVAVAMAFLYRAAPNVDIPFRWVTPGAVMFVVLWIIATIAFGFYVSNIASYNATYGTLGGVIVLMVWLYLTALIALIGAELNAVLQARVQPEAMHGPKAQGQRDTVAEKREEARSLKVEQDKAEPVGKGR